MLLLSTKFCEVIPKTKRQMALIKKMKDECIK